MTQYDYLVKLLIIGDSGVGKSSLLSKFADGKFKHSMNQTVGMDYKMKMFERGGKRMKLQIWDTAGQERYHTITQQYYRNALGIILVYDCNNEDSFANIRKWAAQIKAHGAEDADLMLFGNKADAETKVIATEAGQALAEEYGIPFMETSAKSGMNVEEAFTAIADAVTLRLQTQESGLSRMSRGSHNETFPILPDRPQEQQRGCCGGGRRRH